LFLCLENGYDIGLVNYEQRKRDLRIETDKAFASGLLIEVHQQLEKENKDLQLQACYDDAAAELLTFQTNFYREIAYNLEHTIHHMALIRVGLTEVSDIEIPEEFGVASSTIKYRQQCAQ
jgi:hypothetical protein